MSVIPSYICRTLLSIRIWLMVIALIMSSPDAQSWGGSEGNPSESRATPQADQTTDTELGRPAISGSQPDHEVKVIDGHVLINPYQALMQSIPSRQKFQTFHEERLWAVTELDQQHSELNRWLAEPIQRPIPVPVITEADYNAKVNDIDAKIRTYEAQQNNDGLSESVKSEARAQLLDLTRQKARESLELITYKKSEQAIADYNNAVNHEDAARATIAETSSYLSKIDESIGDLMMTSDSEGFFRLWMGGGFLVLVLVLIVCFFVFGSRSGSMRDIFKDDRGLQFITLFSLVIAITMFGLLNILEGRELSALLGGLSGYILGRSNLGDKHVDARPEK